MEFSESRIFKKGNYDDVYVEINSDYNTYFKFKKGNVNNFKNILDYYGLYPHHEIVEENVIGFPFSFDVEKDVCKLVEIMILIKSYFKNELRMQIKENKFRYKGE